jgi:hypothetical protein
MTIVRYAGAMNGGQILLLNGCKDCDLQKEIAQKCRILRNGFGDPAELKPGFEIAN